MDIVIAFAVGILAHEVIVRFLERRRVLASKQAREKMHEAIERLDRIGRVVQ